MRTLTTREIAAAMGVPERTVLAWARAENWPAAAGHGRTKRFLVDLLPRQRKDDISGALPLNTGQDQNVHNCGQNIPQLPEIIDSEKTNPVPGGANHPVVRVIPGTRNEYMRVIPGTRNEHMSPELPRNEDMSPDLPSPELQATELTSLKGWQRRVMEARLALFAEFKRLEGENTTSRAMDIFLARVRNGALPEHLQRLVPVANARGGNGGRTISKATIYRWKAMDKGGPAAFAPRVKERRDIPAWAPYFLKCYQRPQKPSIPEAMREMALILPDDIPMPSYHQVRRWQKKRSSLDTRRGRHLGSALKRFKGYCRRSTDNLLPLDVVQCDGHSFKAKVANPFHGRPFKPEVCAVIDMKTRMCLGWSAGLAESAHTVADALRHAMTVNDAKPWGGVPAILYTDKGAGNMAHMLEDPVTGILARAGITHKTGIPGNAQGRGMVEKSNQRLWISAARKLETFVGATMDRQTQRAVYLLLDREVRKTGTCARSELPTWQQFLEICRRAMLDYNNTPHAGLRRIKDNSGRVRHMTPAEAWFTAIREGWKPHLLDPAILDDLFRPQVKRTSRRAQVELFGNIYYNPDLEHYHGRRVIVEYDIHDPRAVRVRDTEQRLICLAQLDRNKRDAFPVPEVERARDKRAGRRIELLERRIEEAEAERAGVIDGDSLDDNLIIEADPGAVERALSRAGTADIVTAEPAGPDVQALEPEPVRLISSDSERFALLLDGLRADPRPLTAEECGFLAEYYRTETGRMYLRMVGDLRIEYGVVDAKDGTMTG